MTESNALPLTAAERAALIERHEELVICRACREWTSYGDSCCGETSCESECPICLELGYA